MIGVPRATMTFVVADSVATSAFADAAGAIAAALELQRTHRSTLCVAVVTGDAEQCGDGRWTGAAVELGDQLASLAHPGQILLSAASAAVVGDGLPGGSRLRDLGRHRVVAGSGRTHVYQLCHPDLSDDFGPLRTADRGVHSLPSQLTSFVGRTEELEAVRQLWTDHPIVTLVGPGGSGKTRLAIELGTAWLHTADGAVWFADLATVADPSLVGTTVASALGVVAQPLQPPEDAIASELGDIPALIIFDNCEHVLTEAGSLARALAAACGRVRILATSREPLGIDGELQHAVAPLALPRDDNDRECDSVRLFVERARAVRPTFALDAPTLGAVSEICRRVDGLPLAIELAAARCRSMAPAEIAEQLRDRLTVLTSTRRDAPGRHRTLDESIRWGFELLDDAERGLLRRLSVFPGSFGLAAAEVVGAAAEVERWQVLDLISTLVNRSLVHMEDASGRSRYRLLETVRAFAAAQLETAGETTATRDRHLRYALQLGESLEEEACARASGAGMVALMDEADDLRAALAWARASGQWHAGARLFAATGVFWNLVSPAEGHRWGTYVAESYTGSARERAHALVWATFAAWAVGDLPAANRFTDEARDLAADLDDSVLAAHVLNCDGRQRLVLGDATAVGCFDRGAEAGAAAGHSLLSVGCLTQAGVALSFAGRLPEAADRVDRALAECRARQDHLFLSLALDMKAWTAMLGGDFAQARAAVAEQPDARWASAPRSASKGLVELMEAWRLSAAGDHERAIEVLDERLAEAHRFQFLAMLAFGGWLPAWLRWRGGRPADDDAMADSRAVMAASGFGFGLPMLDAMQALYAVERDPDEAVEHLRRVDEALTPPLSRLFSPLVRNATARVALARGDVRTADLAAHDALVAYNAAGVRWGVPESLETLARAATARDRHEHAARLLGAAHAARAVIGWNYAVPEQAEIDAMYDKLRASLSDEAFEAAITDGRAMTEDQAFVYATRGRGERTPRGFGWEGLTPAERDVTMLAAQGLRNSQIAEKLLVTPATVKTHLAHVYAKLGVRTRAELASEVHQRRQS